MTSLWFYGGVGEIGGNKILFEDAETRLFFDFGISFAQKRMFYEEFIQPRTNSGVRDLLKIDLLPKLDGIYRQDYLKMEGIEDIVGHFDRTDYWISRLKSYQEYTEENGEPFLKGVFVTHAHADHFQYISFLDPEIPVYCSKITKCLIEAAYDLSTSGLESDTFKWRKKALGQLGSTAYFPGAPKISSEEAQEREFITFEDNETVDIGNTSVRTFPVDHSVPGATAFLIETSDNKKVVYTGDIRFHGRQSELSEAFRDAITGLRPNALIIEGTRVEETTLDKESLVDENIRDTVSQCPALAMVGFAWKDTTRFLTLKNVAEETGRTLVISPKLAYTLNKLRICGMTEIPEVEATNNIQVYLKRKGSMLYSEGDYVLTKYDAGYSVTWDKTDPSTIDLSHYNHRITALKIRENPEQYILHLSYYELNELVDLEPEVGSIYIRASSEPFDEEAMLDEKRMIQWFTHFGVNSANDHRPIQIHASGHMSHSDISDLIERTDPRVVFPVHTEKPEDFLAISDRTRLPEIGRTFDV